MNPSRAAAPLAAVLLCALALAAAFPKLNAAWLSPVALVGLFAVWMRAKPKAAFGLGYAAGVLYFALCFSWFGETAGAFLGPFAFLISSGPAVIEAVAFGLAGLVTAYAVRYVAAPLAPLAGAAAFVAFEWLRSSGEFGVPFGQLAAPFVATPLAPLAAFVGGYGLTFTIAVAAAYAAAALLDRSRERVRALAVVLGIGILATIAANLTWPARTILTPTISVAAVQGNIKQTLKNEHSADSLKLAVDRYTALTQTLANQHVRLILWPETVITTDLGNPQNAALSTQFGDLAKSLGAMLVVGAFQSDSARYYNALWVYGTGGAPMAIYRKRQLVPFAEYLPGGAALRRLPFTNLVSDFGRGSDRGIIDPTGLSFSPLICWESVFGDLAIDQTQHGSQLLAIATDDAWFGESAGPYQHAQIASLRAIETGRWVLRAASTGISGSIAPNGRYTHVSKLDTQAVVVGNVGVPQPGPYARIGPLPIGVALLILALGPFVVRRRA